MTLHPRLRFEYGHSAYGRGAVGPGGKVMPTSTASAEESVSLCALFGDGVDGELEDLAFLTHVLESHPRQ